MVRLQAFSYTDKHVAVAQSLCLSRASCHSRVDDETDTEAKSQWEGI